MGAAVESSAAVVGAMASALHSAELRRASARAGCATAQLRAGAMLRVVAAESFEASLCGSELPRASARSAGLRRRVAYSGLDAAGRSCGERGAVAVAFGCPRDFQCAPPPRLAASRCGKRRPRPPCCPKRKWGQQWASDGGLMPRAASRNSSSISISAGGSGAPYTGIDSFLTQKVRRSTFLQRPGTWTVRSVPLGACLSGP